MGLNKRSSKSAPVQTNNTNTNAMNDIFAAYETETPVVETPMTQTTSTKIAMFRYHLNLKNDFESTNNAIAAFHNGKLYRTRDGKSTFFSFRLKSDKSGAVRMTKLLPNGTVETVDVEDIMKDYSSEVSVMGTFRDGKGNPIDPTDVSDYLEGAAAITISVPVDSFSDRGESSYNGIKINTLGADMSYLTIHTDPFVDGNISGEEMEDLFPTTKSTKSGPTAENLRRRWKKANKKAAVQAAQETQELIADVVESAPALAPAPVVDTEKEALRQENAALRAQMDVQSQQLAAMQQQLAMLCERLNAPAAAAPVVETPAPVVAPEPVIEEEPVVEPEPEVEEVEEAPESDKKAALLAMLQGAKSYEPAALETAVETTYGGVSIDFDEE